MIYLDYAAATPIDKKVREAMEPFFANEFYNPNAAYTVAREVRAKYEDARHRIAKTIGANSAEIIMTAGATESINLAVLSFDNILASEIEHPAVTEAVLSRGGEIIKVDKNGRIDLDDLRAKITSKTELISVGYANNEIGTVQPIREIAEIVRNEREKRMEQGNKTPIYLHTDASQAAGYLDLNIARLGVDLMTLNAAKCYGPKQVGCLFVRGGIELKPLVFGGGQEGGLRSGTENIAGAIGMATALELAEKYRKNENKRLLELKQDLTRFLDEKFADKIKFNGHKKHSLPSILNFSIAGLDGERAVFALDFAGVCVATGSACAANRGTRSKVLTAIGLSDELADGSLRISFGRKTTDTEIEKVKEILLDEIQKELLL